MIKDLKEKNVNEKNNNSSEKNIKNKKTYLRIGIIWIVVIILGFINHRIEEKGKTPEIVFTRTDEAPKELKEKIYVFYPEKNNIINTEIIIPKTNSNDELIKVTISEIVKKLEENNFIPKIELKDISYYVLDKKIYLDLPEKIFDNVTNAQSELLLIYSFVNSLTNINDIENVRILINNADLEKVKYANLLKDYKYKKNI